MEYQKKLYIGKAEIEKWERLMDAEEVDYDAEGINSYSSAASWTMDFGNGFQMDVKVCTGSRHDGDAPNGLGNPLYAEGVLFKNGEEITLTDVAESLDGVEFACGYRYDTYSVLVLRAEEQAGEEPEGGEERA